MRADPRSLRYRALVVVVAVVALPVVWVWTAGLFETGSVISLRRTLYVAAGEAVAALETGGDLDDIARRRGVWLRVLGAEGDLIAEHDHAVRTRWFKPVADPFYGEGGVPELSRADATLPPLTEREEVQLATTTPVSRCDVHEDGLILVCSAAQRTVDGRVVHLQLGSPRLVRSLWDDRFQLVAVSLVVLVVGIVLALWLGWRMVGPIEQLRDQVVARTRGTVSTKPVELERSDEIGELAEAFNALLAALEDRNRLNAGFAADLAHELKNPVAAVRGAAEAMAGERPIEGRRRERLVRVLADSSARMERVVNGFLDLARAEAGLPDAEREPLRLDDLARALVEPLANDPRFEGVAFEVEGEAPEIDAVPERIETALRNLLVNAATFAGDGGAVTVRAGLEAGEVVLAVEDTGPGIPEADLARVFDRYFTTRDGGTGLGLPLTKAIVEAHGGQLTAGNRAEGGAVFTLRLPPRA